MKNFKVKVLGCVLIAITTIFAAGSGASAANLIVGFWGDPGANYQHLREYQWNGSALSQIADYAVTTSWAMPGVASMGDIDADGTSEYFAWVNTGSPGSSPRGFNPSSAAAEKVFAVSPFWNDWGQIKAVTYADYDNDGEKELITSFYDGASNYVWPTRIDWASGQLTHEGTNFAITSSWAITGMAGLGDPDNDGTWEYIAGIHTGSPGSTIRAFNANSAAAEKVFDVQYWQDSFAINDLAYGDYDNDGTDELIIALYDGSANYLWATNVDWANAQITFEANLGWTPGWSINGLSFVVPEPATMSLLGLGAVGLLFRRRNGR